MKRAAPHTTARLVRCHPASWLACLLVGCGDVPPFGVDGSLGDVDDAAVDAGDAGDHDIGALDDDPATVPTDYSERVGASALADAASVRPVTLDAGAFSSTEARLVPSMQVMEAAGCRVSFDASDDGVIDARWGFEYGSDGRLRRFTHAPADPAELQVTELDAEERPRLSCTEHRCVRFLFSEDARTLHIDSHIATQLEREPTYELRYDEHGRLSSWQHIDGDERSGTDRRVQLNEGVPSEATFTDFFYGDRDIATWSFHDSGALKARSANAIWRHHSEACTEDGWQSEESYDDDAGTAFQVVTEYTRDADGRIASSRTSLSGKGETHVVQADWAWNGSGGAVTLTARDTRTGASWTFPVVVGAGEVAREHDPETGELRRVLVDGDGDGAADTAHRYLYEGAGRCRDGSNPQLQPLPTALLDLGLPERCRFSPGVPTLLAAYRLGPR